MADEEDDDEIDEEFEEEEEDVVEEEKNSVRNFNPNYFQLLSYFTYLIIYYIHPR